MSMIYSKQHWQNRNHNFNGDLNICFWLTLLDLDSTAGISIRQAFDAGGIGYS